MRYLLGLHCLAAGVIYSISPADAVVPFIDDAAFDATMLYAAYRLFRGRPKLPKDTE